MLKVSFAAPDQRPVTTAPATAAPYASLMRGSHFACTRELLVTSATSMRSTCVFCAVLLRMLTPTEGLDCWLAVSVAMTVMVCTPSVNCVVSRPALHCPLRLLPLVWVMLTVLPFSTR